MRENSSGTRDEFLIACELHSLERLHAVLDAGLDLHAPIKGRTPVETLLEMYLRSDEFAGCLRLLLDRGGRLPDPVIAPVLLDDANELGQALRADPALVRHRTTLVSAFTPLVDVSLLHVAAEYGQLNA